jgi:predicted TIM-barrel fold metal-dependent hydrolase
LADLIKRRERASGTHDISVYSVDAQILDISDGEDNWVRGRDGLERMLTAYASGVRFIPNMYEAKGPIGFIAGVIRSKDSNVDEMHFMFGVKKDATGAWKIETEYATNKPPLAYARPITADKIIQVMDDAGIKRAVVLSLAYWFGDGLFKGTSGQEYAKVREENDWAVAQVNRFPGRLVAFCGVNPLKEYAIREIERCSRMKNVKGMKLHFGNSHVDVKNPAHVAKVKQFFRAANAARMAIVVHLWTLDPTYGRKDAEIFLNEILPEAPDVVVQIAHLGGGGRYQYDDVTDVFAGAIEAHDPRTKNVYFDMATVVTERQSAETLQLIARRPRQIGLKRILFGADTPTIAHDPPLVAWATLRRRLPLTDEELRIIANNVAPYLADP